jgi:hypothetical protein
MDELCKALALLEEFLKTVKLPNDRCIYWPEVDRLKKECREHVEDRSM